MRIKDMILSFPANLLCNKWMGEGILGAVLSVGIFLGKMCGMMFFFLWIRWTLPRFRYDQVMKLGWKILLPLSIANLVVYTIFIFYLDTKL